MVERGGDNLINAEKSLVAVNDSIRNCDAKAGVLLTAVGIVFGFSLFSIDAITKSEGPRRFFALLLGGAYLLSFAVSLILLVLIVIPRGRNKREQLHKKDFPLYVDDIYEHASKGDLKEFVSGTVDEESLVEQIKVCSRIGRKKESYLIVASFTIIAFVVSLVSLVVCLVI